MLSNSSLSHAICFKTKLAKLLSQEELYLSVNLKAKSNGRLRGKDSCMFCAYVCITLQPGDVMDRSREGELGLYAEYLKRGGPVLTLV